jgi:hypothetical protein
MRKLRENYNSCIIYHYICFKSNYCISEKLQLTSWTNKKYKMKPYKRLIYDFATLIEAQTGVAWDTIGYKEFCFRMYNGLHSFNKY